MRAGGARAARTAEFRRASECPVLTEPASHLSADEDGGAAQVQEPNGHEGGARVEARVDQRAQGHPPVGGGRAQHGTNRDLSPRVVSTDDLSRTRAASAGAKGEQSWAGWAAAHSKKADQRRTRQQDGAGHSGADLERPAYRRKGGHERVRRRHARISEWRSVRPPLVDELLERGGAKGGDDGAKHDERRNEIAPRPDGCRLSEHHQPLGRAVECAQGGAGTAAPLLRGGSSDRPSAGSGKLRCRNAKQRRPSVQMVMVRRVNRGEWMG